MIDYPDSLGAACNYRRQGFYLGGHFAAAYLPNMAYFGLGAVPGSICDSLYIGVNDLSENKNGITIFPNPSSGIFSLQLKDATDKIISVHVENIYGKEILNTKNFYSVVDLGQEPAGIYFVKVKTQKKKSFTGKAIKL